MLSTWVCSRHFPNGDASKSPSTALGKRFVSPMKQGLRAKQARKREEKMLKEQCQKSIAWHPWQYPLACRLATPAAPPLPPKVHTIVVGDREQLSTTQTSQYLTTWICFLYHHQKEIDWVPTGDQVIETLLYANDLCNQLAISIARVLDYAGSNKPTSFFSLFFMHKF